MIRNVLLISTALIVVCLLLLGVLGGTEQLMMAMGLVIVGGFLVSIVLAISDTIHWAAYRLGRR